MINCEADILDRKAELALSINEKEEYLEELREYLKKRKPTTTSIGATTLGVKLLEPTRKLALKTKEIFTSKDCMWKWDGQEYIPKGACIIASSHQGLLDNFLHIPIVKQHCIILHGKDVNPILKFVQLNTGLVWVIKGDKRNNFEAKLDMIHLLLSGHSIYYCPESTWNLSPNKLHLPMGFGFLDIAMKAKVPVMPLVHEFSYSKNYKGKLEVNRIHTRFGKPIYVSSMDNLTEKLYEYEEQISTIKWELIEEKGLFSRNSIHESEYIDYLEKQFRDLKLGQLDWARETRCIYGSNNPFYLDHFINDIEYDSEHRKLLSRPNKVYDWLSKD